MPQWTRQSSGDQLTAHLRAELLGGRWTGRLPGVHSLAQEYAVNRKTVEVALERLEGEGLLVPQGPGRRRRIVLPKKVRRQWRRVGIPLGEPADRNVGYIVDLEHGLAGAGHQPNFPPYTMMELGMNVGRISRMIRKNPANAWIVLAGSQPLLDWFVAEGLAVFALFGRRRGLPIASVGPDKVPAMRRIVRELAGFGHRRIVLLVRPRRRLPEPGAPEQAFLDELGLCGISPGNYHLPAWDLSIQAFHECLESLFRVTPPTALVVDEEPPFFATMQFLGRRGLRVPEDVSLVCTDDSPNFAWSRPTVAHIRWDKSPLVRRMVRWASNVSAGLKDTRQTFTRAEFVPGGTVGPARNDR